MPRTKNPISRYALQLGDFAVFVASSKTIPEGIGYNIEKFVQSQQSLIASYSLTRSMPAFAAGQHDGESRSSDVSSEGDCEESDETKASSSAAPFLTGPPGRGAR